MAKVDIVKEGDTAGVFVTNEKGQMALLAQEQYAQLYVSFRPEGWDIPWAIALNEKNNLNLQVPKEDGSGVEMTVDLRKVAKLFAKLTADES